jgi:hypothetical protein
LVIAEDGRESMNVLIDSTTNMHLKLPNDAKSGEADGNSGRKTPLLPLSKARFAWLDSGAWVGKTLP